MLLAYRDNQFNIPYSSTCILQTTGRIYDGDIVTVISPVFSSINYTSRAINTSDSLSIKIIIKNKNGYIDNDNKEMKLTMICDDNDIFNMHVQEQI